MKRLLAAVLLTAACNNMLTAHLTPVPPVHHVPRDLSGTVILIDKDPEIESKDPNHRLRATEQGVPRGYRTALTNALSQAGFSVVDNASAAHALTAKLAIAVTEYSDDNIKQVYRCGLYAPDGKLVSQVDWTWPKGIYVDVNEVFDFATHNVATDVATSPDVHAFLRKAPAAAPAPAP